MILFPSIERDCDWVFKRNVRAAVKSEVWNYVSIAGPEVPFVADDVMILVVAFLTSLARFKYW